MTETDARRGSPLEEVLPSTVAGAVEIPARRALPGWAATAGIWAAWAAAAACVVLTLLWRAGNGFDHIDEAFYLLTAAPPRPDDAFNGLSGLYLRRLWEVAGWNVAVVRVLGGVALVATAVLLGAATARLIDRRPAAVVAATVAAATGYYVPLLRTPSYNWLAVVGAGLACTGALRLLARQPARWGALCGLGIVVAGVGKATTGLALALVVVAVALRTRPRALAWSAAVGLLALVVHVVAVLPLGATLHTLARSSRHLAVFSPVYYTPSGVILETVLGLALTLAFCTAYGRRAGRLPLAAAPHPRRARSSPPSRPSPSCSASPWPSRRASGPCATRAPSSAAPACSPSWSACCWCSSSGASCGSSGCPPGDRSPRPACSPSPPWRASQAPTSPSASCST